MGVDPETRTIRAMLCAMCPKRAVEYIKAFELPPEEEMVLIEREVRKRSVQQIADAYKMSPETVKHRRRAAFHKIKDGIHFSDPLRPFH